MTNLFPPVLENRARSIPFFAGDPSNVDAYRKEKFYDIRFKMPDMNDYRVIRHIQVSIRYQATMQPAVNNLLSPDRQCLYIDAGIDDMRPEKNIYWEKDGDDGYFILHIPYYAFEFGLPQKDTTYCVQVRFGENVIWANGGTGLDGTGHNNFAAWRQREVTRVPSGFGEWSNVQTVYCYNSYSKEFVEDMKTIFRDFTPQISWTYKPTGDDPLEQVRVFYYYQGFEGTVTKDMVFNGSLGNDNNYSLNIRLNVAPVVPIKCVIQGVTKNNTIIDDYIDIPPLRTAVAGLGILYGELKDVELENDEVDDGILAKTAQFPTLPNGEGISVYRSNLYNFETIKIIDHEVPGQVNEFEFRDYTVEMGDEYIYTVCQTDTKGDIKALLLPLTWGFENPGYARLMRMDSSYLTTRRHQLRLQGDVQLSAFKRNVNEQLQTTIGSKYPFYSRNGKNNYRSFQLQAFVSVNFDPTASFMRNDPENGLYWDDEESSTLKVLDRDLYSSDQFSLSRRRIQSTKMIQKNERIVQLGTEDHKIHYDDEGNPIPGPEITFGPKSIYDQKLMKNTQMNYGTSQTNELIYIERKFREAVMSWLSDGKPKLFRSETEGNMIVQVTGVSFTPYKAANRMVYSFSATITEIADCDLENLIRYNLVPSIIESYYNKQSPFAFVPGDDDPNIVTKLIFEYYPSFDIPSTEVNTQIREINLNSGIKNGSGKYECTAINLPEGIHFVCDPILKKTYLTGTPTEVRDEHTQAKLTITDVGERDEKVQWAENALANFTKTINYAKYDSDPAYKAMVDARTKSLQDAITEAENMVCQTASIFINIGYIYSQLVFSKIDVSIPVTTVGVPIDEFSVLGYASGGIPQYTFSAYGLPIGLSIDYNTGIIHGSYANDEYAGQATISVFDQMGQQAVQVIQYGQGVYPLSLKNYESFALGENEQGQPIEEKDFHEAASGGYPPYTWSAANLPLGLSIDPNTGVLSGTPENGRGPGEFTITVTDTKKTSATITVPYDRIYDALIFRDGPELDFTNLNEHTAPFTPLNYGWREEKELMSEDNPYVTGGKEPYTFSAVNLRPDFDIKPATGKMWGMAQVGNPDFRLATITVTDARGRQESIQIIIAPIASTLIFNGNYSLPEALVGVAPPGYEIRIPMDTISGGVGKKTLSLSGFPAGVTLEVKPDPDTLKETAVITGIPTATYNAGGGKIICTDESKPIALQTEVFVKIGNVYQPLRWSQIPSTLNIPKNTTNKNIQNVKITNVTGGKPPYSIRVLNGTSVAPYKLYTPNQSYPNGFYIGGNSGPSPMEEVLFDLEITDSFEPKGLTPPATITGITRGRIEKGLGVVCVEEHRFNNIPLMVGESNVNDPDWICFTGTGGSGQYEFLVDGQLNGEIIKGLVLNSQTGVVSGRPTQIVTSMNMKNRITVRDKVDGTTAPLLADWFTPSVYAPPTPTNIPSTNLGWVTKYNTYDVATKFFTLAGFSDYSVATQNAPKDIEMTKAFTLYGKITNEATSTPFNTVLTVTVNGASGRIKFLDHDVVRSRTVTFNGVKTGISFSAANLGVVPPLTLGEPYDLDLSPGLDGGTLPIVWNVAPLPPGLSFEVTNNGRNCHIKGTPTAETGAGTQTQIVVTDGAGLTDSDYIQFSGVYPPMVVTPSPAYNITNTQPQVDIPPVDLSPAVTGGVPPYKFFDDGQLTKFGYDLDMNTGVISGKSGVASTKAANVVITFEDSVGQTKTMTINVAAIIGNVAIDFSPNPVPSIPNGNTGTTGTLNISAGIIPGNPPYKINVIKNYSSSESEPGDKWTFTQSGNNIQYTRPSNGQWGDTIIVEVEDSKQTLAKVNVQQGVVFGTFSFVDSATDKPNIDVARGAAYSIDLSNCTRPGTNINSFTLVSGGWAGMSVALVNGRLMLRGNRPNQSMAAGTLNVNIRDGAGTTITVPVTYTAV